MSKPSLNPMHSTFSASPPPPISTRTFTISGISTLVYGLTELPPIATNVAVLWLLHPRLESAEMMQPVAAVAVTAWNAKVQRGEGDGTKGLIAVSIDLRNHGGRLVDPRANEVWRTGNRDHAKDMFSGCHGTTKDISLLIDHLASYVFPAGNILVSQHICLGVSLGGHTTWQLLVHEPRITTCIVVIGSADFIRLLTDRARLSKIPDYIASSPPGSKFLGSPSFPATLVETIKNFDAAQLIMGKAYGDPEAGVDERVRERLRGFYEERLRGKRLLVVSGGADKMAPYSRSEPVISFLKGAVRKNGGWWRVGAMEIKAVVVPGVKHELTMGMVGESLEYILESVERGSGGASGKSYGKLGVKL